MILTGIFRSAKIKSELSDLRLKQMKLQDKIAALAQYSANIADGIITPEEMANSPASVFGRQMNYMISNIPMAMIQGSQAFSLYMGQYGPQMQAFSRDPSMAMMMNANPMMLQMNFFKQALERQGKIEQEKLHVEEKKLQKELSGIEVRIKMLETEQQSLAKAVDNEIRQNAPKFGFSAHG